MVSKGQSRHRDLGELGQDHFKAWCSENGLAATRSSPDRFGWDFFLEFEPETDPEVPLDRHLELKKMLVQVKSTDGAQVSVRAKLSALKRLVDADLPAFIVHLDYSKRATPRLARLLHIGPSQISSILERIRKAEKDGRFDLHNISLSLPLNDATVISENGENLHERLLGPMPKSVVEYVQIKSSFRRACGYDAGSIKAHFGIAPGQGAEALVDLLIGKVPDIRLKGAIIDKQRFGISLERDIDRLDSGILRVDIKPLQRAKIIVSSPTLYLRRRELSVDVYSPGMPGLPAKHQKIRITNKFLDMIIHFGRAKANMVYQISPDTKYSLDELSDALAFGVAMSDSEAEFEVDFGQGRLQKLNVPSEAKALSGWKLLAEFSETLRVAWLRHMRGGDCRVTLRDLEHALEDNRNMFALLSRPGLDVTVSLDDDSPVVPSSGAFAVPVCIEFDAFVYVAIVRSEFGKLERDNEKIRIVGLAPTIIEDHVLPRAQFQVVELNRRVTEIATSESSKERCIISTTLDET